ncbi:MAG: hypothetical protein QM503_05305 [Bacteroidota bacterium]
MKKLTIFYLCIFLVIFSPDINAQWSSDGSAGSCTVSTGITTAVALNSSGTPYVVFIDNSNSDKATVKYYDGSSWQTVGTAGFSAGSVTWVDIAIDNSDNIFVAYSDNGNSDYATVMKSTGGNFSLVGSAGFSNAAVENVSIDTDGTYPYVSFRDEDDTFIGKAMAWSGTTWSLIGGGGFSAGFISTNEIVAVSNTEIYVGYTDGGELVNAGSVRKWDGSSWEYVGSRDITPSDVAETTLARDGNGNLYFGFTDVNEGDLAATVLRWNGSSWTTLGAAGFTAAAATWNSIAIDSDNNPYFAYKDGGNSDKATVMRYNGTAWINVGSPGFSSAGNSTSLALDANDIPYVAYHQTDNTATLYQHSTNTWDGSTDTDWATAANWSGNVVPTTGYDVIIANVANDPTIGVSTDADCNDLTVNSSGVLTLNSTSTTNGASLLINGTYTNNGTLNVKRYLEDNAWHLITPSTTSVTANDFRWNDSPKSWIVYHTETDDSWTYITDPNTDLNVGQGYMVWIDNNTKTDATATMTGDLRNTALSPTITDNGNGENVVGNPFPCAIDWDQGTWTKDVTSTVYVWDNSINDYVYWNGSAGDLTLGVIPMGQGFTVDADGQGGSASLTIPLDARLHSPQDFYKTAADDNDEPYIRLQLDGENIGNTLFIGFPSHGTDYFDMIKGDGRKLYSSDSTTQLFAVEDGEELCINTNKPLIEGESKTIPLNLVQVINGNYTLSVTGFETLENYSINLEDTKTTITQNLKVNPVYNFSASQNDVAERFLLHFAWSPDGIDNPQDENTETFNIYSYGQTVYINSLDNKYRKGTIQICDMFGRTILNEQIHINGLSSYKLNISNVYVIVKIVTDGEISTKKLHIN